jgi:hypothetical protein
MFAEAIFPMEVSLIIIFQEATVNNKTLRNLIFIWLSWFLILYAFQWLVQTRLDIKRPDYAVFWSATETLKNSNKGKIYLEEPFLNRQVAWDSEYYLGIAVGGYDDPAAGRAEDPETGIAWPKNYSFFPVYPYLVKLFMIPMSGFGLTPIANAALAGVIVALLGTLAGLIALWDMTRAYFDQEDALRAGFYLLIFPSAFFFAQVYTEGLFIGLAFWTLALSKRKQWFWAGILALVASWTRAHGGLLFIPLGLAWLRALDWKNLRGLLTWARFAEGAWSLLPLLGYLAWRNSHLGEGWAALQSFYFGRGVLTLQSSIASWLQSYQYALTANSALIYFSMEVGCVVIALIASLALLKVDPEVAAFSLAVVVFSAFSGSAQSEARYMLVAPALAIFLAMLGRNKVFDRAWVILSLLLMGMSVMLYSFDMWVG